MVDQFLRREAVERATGLSRSAIYEMMADGTFPKPVKLGGTKAVAWLGSEIEAWQKLQIEARDTKAA